MLKLYKAILYKITHKNVMPRTIDDKPIIDYLLERTLKRPRDIILFFNSCINRAIGREILTVTKIREAEGEYSRNRLRALYDEWFTDYPNLKECVEILKMKNSNFSVSEVSNKEVDNICVEIALSNKPDEISNLAKYVCEHSGKVDSFKNYLFFIFYHVGLIEIKLEPYGSFFGISSGRRNISPAEINEETKVFIHPAFNRVLGTRSQ
jgi:hypothetical protein